MRSQLWLSIFIAVRHTCVAFVHTPGLSRRSVHLRTTKFDDLFSTRREALAIGLGLGTFAVAPKVIMALGTLPETEKLTRAFAQAVVRVNDTQAMVDFCTNGLGMSIRRSYTRTSDGSRITVLGYGPEEFGIPGDFIPGISSFSEYGSHFSLQLEEAAEGAPAVGDESGSGQTYDPGNGLAYIGLGVPQYRISKVVENGGQIVSSFGYTVVVSPCGLTFQVVLGDQVRDPFMFAALRVSDVKASEKYYTQLLGMKRFQYPKARLALKSPFEPDQPKKSVFLSYSEDTFGLLLLPRVMSASGSSWPNGMTKVNPGNVFSQLRLVTSDIPNTPGNAAVAGLVANEEPDGYGIGFVDSGVFAGELLAGSKP